MKIQRIILSSDDGHFLDFLPVVSMAWQKLLGIKPTLAYVSNETIPTWAYQFCQDVIRYPVWEDINSPSARAFAARLLIRNKFGDDCCMISDMDMIPLSSKVFTELPSEFSSDKFLSINFEVFKYGDGDTPINDPNLRKFPSCYTAATSKTWNDILNPKNLNDNDLLRSWYNIRVYDYKESVNRPNFCDESLVRMCIQRWNPFRDKVVGVDTDINSRRVARSHWNIDKDLLLSNHYIDAHCPRPLRDHILEVKPLADFLGIPLLLPESLK